MEVSNTRAISIFAAYLTTDTLLFLLISGSTRSASQSRALSSNARQCVALFRILEAASLAITWYYMLSFFGLSYKSWGFDRGVQMPAKPDTWSLDGTYQALSSIKLGAWLKDVKLFRDAWETVVETPARTCWSMPIFFITTAWSLFIAKEAPRRNIRHAWAYMVLGQLVAISFAMNLFYLAVISHPIQARSRSRNDDPTQQMHSSKVDPNAGKTSATAFLWTPPSYVYWIILFSTFFSIVMATTSAGDKHFMLYLALPHVLLLLPPILDSVLPQRFGTYHTGESTYNAFYTSKITFTLVLGIVFEVTAVYLALSSPAEQVRHSHRHSNVFQYAWQSDIVNSTETPFQNLGRSLLDHPAVSSVGWDSILCTASFIAWRVTRPDS